MCICKYVCTYVYTHTRICIMQVSTKEKQGEANEINPSSSCWLALPATEAEALFLSWLASGLEPQEIYDYHDSLIMQKPNWLLLCPEAASQDLGLSSFLAKRKGQQ